MPVVVMLTKMERNATFERLVAAGLDVESCELEDPSQNSPQRL
jgi:hypothetical protein